MRKSANQKEEDAVRILLETAESFNLDAHSWTSSQPSKVVHVSRKRLVYPAEVCTVFELGDLNSTREEWNIFRALLPFSVYISFNRVRGVGIRDLNGTMQGY